MNRGWVRRTVRIGGVRLNGALIAPAPSLARPRRVPPPRPLGRVGFGHCTAIRDFSNDDSAPQSASTARPPPRFPFGVRVTSGGTPPSRSQSPVGSCDTQSETATLTDSIEEQQRNDANIRLVASAVKFPDIGSDGTGVTCLAI